jgi:hypothetical protein
VAIGFSEGKEMGIQLKKKEVFLEIKNIQIIE